MIWPQDDPDPAPDDTPTTRSKAVREGLAGIAMPERIPDSARPKHPAADRRKKGEKK